MGTKIPTYEMADEMGTKLPKSNEMSKVRSDLGTIRLVTLETHLNRKSFNVNMIVRIIGTHHGSILLTDSTDRKYMNRLRH